MGNSYIKWFDKFIFKCDGHLTSVGYPKNYISYIYIKAVWYVYIKFCVSTILAHTTLQVYLNAKSAGQLLVAIWNLNFHTYIHMVL